MADKTGEVESDANRVRIKTPKFLTLVGLPANQTAFKVVRSADTGTKGESTVAAPIIRRTRRSDSKSPILRLTLPTDYDDAQVSSVLDSFGLSEFSVTRSDTAITAMRSDLKSTSNLGETQDIKLTADGIVATVAKSDSTAAKNPKSELAITSIVFREGTFDAESVKSWLSDNGFGEVTTELSPGQEVGSYLVTRGEVPEGEETRVVPLADGVEATIVRADASDIPAAFVASVNETAYGNWGWGHLDFAATLADKDFSEHMRSAVSALEDVLRQILFYSPLPIAERKALVGNALKQFGTYADNLLDSLPRQILVAVARSAQPQPEKATMTQAQSGAATTTTGSTPKTTAPAGGDMLTISRSDLQPMIVEGVTAALQARSDAEAAAKAQEDAAAAKAAADAAAAETVQRSVKEAVELAVKPLAERLDQISGTTSVRSGDTDQKTKTTDESGKPKDVFRGAIPGLRSGPSNVAATTTKV